MVDVRLLQTPRNFATRAKQRRPLGAKLKIKIPPPIVAGRRVLRCFHLVRVKRTAPRDDRVAQVDKAVGGLDVQHHAVLAAGVRRAGHVRRTRRASRRRGGAATGAMMPDS